jgi:hypothetical protein
LDWFRIPLLPQYSISTQIVTGSATFVAVLLAFGAAYARSIGGPAVNRRLKPSTLGA